MNKIDTEYIEKWQARRDYNKEVENCLYKLRAEKRREQLKEKQQHKPHKRPLWERITMAATLSGGIVSAIFIFAQIFIACIRIDYDNIISRTNGLIALCIGVLCFTIYIMLLQKGEDKE